MSTERTNQYFSDDEYCGRLKVPSDGDAQEKEKTSLERAFETANDCRKFETGYFWQRGTYYWAFIVASFTAHFKCMENFFKDKPIRLDDIKSLPGFSLLMLTVTAFFCFFFSYAWVIVNKGSSFWQKNWERHIDRLEEKVIGQMFNIVMNEGNRKRCSPNIFSLRPYRYSVGRMTQLTGIVLMVASLVMFGFYSFLLCWPWLACLWVVGIVVILVVFFVSFLQVLDSKPKRKGTGRSRADWYEA